MGPVSCRFGRGDVLAVDDDVEPLGERAASRVAAGPAVGEAAGLDLCGEPRSDGARRPCAQRWLVGADLGSLETR